MAHTDFDRFCVIDGAARYAEIVRVREGPEGPPMWARRAPQCPPQELEGGARRALNF